LERTISLQVAEAIIGSCCINNSKTLMEKLLHIPSCSVRDVIAMDRMHMCAEYASNKNKNEHSLPSGLQQYEEHIDFYGDVIIRDESVHQIYSWKTLKSENQKSEFPFMLSRQRNVPKDGEFLTN
jgi:hypothetical protein